MMFLDEWKYVFRTKGLLRIILGILLIPTFYAVIFLASLWNPYSNVKHLPVGIVNNDVKIVKHQTSYSLGKALTNRLTQTDDADFKALNQTRANHDLKTGKLYMVITIPKSFSQQATQVGQRPFKNIDLNYHTNAGFSFIAMKLSTTIAESVQKSVNQQLTTAYLQVMAQTLTNTGKQLITADQALAQTNTGLKRATNGEHQLIAADQTFSHHEAEIQNGLTQLASGTAKLTVGLKQITHNNQQLAQILTTATQKQSITANKQAVQKLLTANTVIAQQAIAGNNQNLAAIQALNQGASKLSTGAASLTGDTIKLAQGTDLIHQTNTKIATGLKAGGQQLIAAGQNTTHQVKTIVSPIKLTHTDTTHVKNNGTGMTPYLMSVALFVGCITFNIIYDMFTPHRRPKDAFDWWGEKIPFFLTFTLAAATIMFLMLLLINRLTPLQPIRTWLFAVLTMWAFGSIVTFFNLIMGKTGAWLMLIFMIIQLGGSAGTYPIQLSNYFFQVIHPYLPMSISIDAFRSTLSIGNSILSETIIFATVILIFNLLMLITFSLNMKKVATYSYDN